ncbi:MAG: hypothetical protein EA426_08565 [Spirochaetaceae bacterium]|nr:MAG: hypothetical protein EA426_08565 [Spirochaetaceae bacterium]
MTTYFLTIGLSYAIIGFAVSLFACFILKKEFIGRFWGALIVALIGSFLGGVIDYVFADLIQVLSNINNTVNIFPPLIAAFVIVWLFGKVSER